MIIKTNSLIEWLWPIQTGLCWWQFIDCPAKIDTSWKIYCQGRIDSQNKFDFQYKSDNQEQISKTKLSNFIVHLFYQFDFQSLLIWFFMVNLLNAVSRNLSLNHGIVNWTIHQFNAERAQKGNPLIKFTPI